MKNWSKLLETLAGKLTAILAFAALIIIVLALIGDRIPKDYRSLVYVLAIGAMRGCLARWGDEGFETRQVSRRESPHILIRIA